MNSKQSKLAFLGVFLLSVLSFVYLNTIGAESAGLTAGALQESLFQLPDAKVTEVILNHVINHIINL